MRKVNIQCEWGYKKRIMRIMKEEIFLQHRLKLLCPSFWLLTISYNFLYKPIILYSYRLSHIYTSRIGLLFKDRNIQSKILIYVWEHKKKMDQRYVLKETVWLRPLTSLVNSTRIFFTACKRFWNLNFLI